MTLASITHSTASRLWQWSGTSPVVFIPVLVSGSCRLCLARNSQSSNRFVLVHTRTLQEHGNAVQSHKYTSCVPCISQWCPLQHADQVRLCLSWYSSLFWNRREKYTACSSGSEMFAWEQALKAKTNKFHISTVTFLVSLSNRQMTNLRICRTSQKQLKQLLRFANFCHCFIRDYS